MAGQMKKHGAINLGTDDHHYAPAAREEANVQSGHRMIALLL